VQRFTNKVALITGGTAGIGYAVAAAFATEGARVVITGRDEKQGRDALQRLQAQGAQARYVSGDASREQDQARWIDYAVKEFGNLNIAVNNAGIEGSPAAITEVSGADFDAVFAVNVRGLLLAMKHQFRAFQSAGGTIVNLSSIVGSIAMPGAAVYIASKHAVEGLTRTAALEGAKNHIRVNAVAPGGVETPMFQRFTGGNAAAQSGLAAAHPLGRVAQPAEISGAVLYLASDEASFTTGAVLSVDGGYTAQ
jgi:NAD(P)-dependent dehydrogenase (short-subunit alcohol dehydrogenase family)